jgi:HEAT repeat protein
VDTPATPQLELSLRTIRESADASAVRSAIMDLGYETAKEAYPVLVEQLNDPNDGIKHAAVISLGRYGNPAAIEELAKPKILRSSNANIRWAAVAAVGKLGDYRVIDHLLKSVEDPEWIVRTQAVTELMGKVREVIGRRDVKLARILIHMFGLDNEEIVSLAIEGFQELGLDSLPLLHDSLNNSSALIRMNSARALGRIKACQSTAYLLDLLKDEDWQVRASAAEALGRIQDISSLEPLVAMIQDNVEKVQDKAAAAIVGFGRQATVSLLNALNLEKDKFAQRAFIKCLGQITDSKSVPSLAGYLRSSYFIVRQAAVSALVRFGPSVASLLVPMLSFNTSDIATLLTDAADKTHPELQLRAIKALGGLEDHRAVKLLKEVVAESLPDVQETATAALSQIGCAAWGRCCALRVIAEVGDAALVPRILLSLKDDSDNVRFEAVRAVAKLGAAEAIPILLPMFKKDRSDFIRAEAVRLLRRIGGGHRELLEIGLKGLKDPGRDVRSQSARLVGGFLDKETIGPLLKAMTDPHWSVRESVEIALLNFGKDAVDPLIEALESSVWTTRFRAARLLGEIGDPRAVAPLEKALDRPREQKSVRENIEAALRKLRSGASA